MSDTHSEKTGGRKVLGALLALFAGCSFGVGGAVSQIVVGQGFSVMQVCFAQYVMAFIIMGLLVLVKFRPTMTRKECLQLVILGVLSSISSFTYYLAIDLLSVSAGVAIQFQYVWIVVAIEAVVERKIPGKWTVISAVLIVGGTVLGSGMMDEIISGGLTMDPLGLFYAIVCAVFYAAFIYFSGFIAQGADPVSKTFFSVTGGVILITVLMPFNGGFTFSFVDIAPWGVLMGLIMSVIPILFIVAAYNFISGGLVGILTSSELPMAVAAGLVLLGQGVTPLIIIGVIVILGAIALAQLDNKGTENAK